MKITTNTFQVYGILAAITAVFSLINLIIVSIILNEGISIISEFYRLLVFTAIFFAATLISGTISAIMIFIKSDAPSIGTFVDMAKATILVGIIIQLQTAVSIVTNTGTKTAVLAMSIIYLIVETAGLIALCYLSIKGD